MKGFTVSANFYPSGDISITKLCDSAGRVYYVKSQVSHIVNKCCAKFDVVLDDLDFTFDAILTLNDHTWTVEFKNLD